MHYPAKLSICLGAGLSCRAHLDLQVNLLAEEELTAIMRMLCGLAAHVGYDAKAANPQLEELAGAASLAGAEDHA